MKYANEFKHLTQSSIDEQARQFLRSFILELAGNFEDVLNLAAEFKKYLRGDETELEEDAAHIFLEKRNETMTVVELREYLKQIGRISHHCQILIRTTRLPLLSICFGSTRRAT